MRIGGGTNGPREPKRKEELVTACSSFCLGVDGVFGVVSLTSRLLHLGVEAFTYSDAALTPRYFGEWCLPQIPLEIGAVRRFACALNLRQHHLRRRGVSPQATLALRRATFESGV